MRLDGVEVKISLDSDQTAAALGVLDLADAAAWKIFFVEDVTAGLCTATPLLDQQLIVRARAKNKGPDDVTVKFRPGRRSQLTDTWLDRKKATNDDLDSELKVEEDWAGERRALSISLTADRPHGHVASVAEGDGDIAALLNDDQKRLIKKCASARVNLAALTMLPAVSASRWPKFPAPGPGQSTLDIRAERWTVADLDFLELSIVADLGAATPAQAALLAFVEGKGLRPATGEAKTTQVLRRLVPQTAC